MVYVDYPKNAPRLTILDDNTAFLGDSYESASIIFNKKDSDPEVIRTIAYEKTETGEILRTARYWPIEILQHLVGWAKD